jgi:hypothetical protein
MTGANPIPAAAVEAIDQVITMLRDARQHLVAGETLAAIGTLVSFDDRAEDVRAALRLLRLTHRRRS